MCPYTHLSFSGLENQLLQLFPIVEWSMGSSLKWSLSCLAKTFNCWLQPLIFETVKCKTWAHSGFAFKSNQLMYLVRALYLLFIYLPSYRPTYLARLTVAAPKICEATWTVVMRSLSSLCHERPNSFVKWLVQDKLCLSGWTILQKCYCFWQNKEFWRIEIHISGKNHFCSKSCSCWQMSSLCRLKVKK